MDCPRSGSAGFFEVLEASIKHLFHAVHLRTEGLLRILYPLVRIGETLAHIGEALVDAAFKTSKALVVDKEAHED